MDMSFSEESDSGEDLSDFIDPRDSSEILVCQGANRKLFILRTNI